MSTNDITGARLVSKVPSKEYKDNYDRIFRKDKQVEDESPKNERCIIHIDDEENVDND